MPAPADTAPPPHPGAHRTRPVWQRVLIIIAAIVLTLVIPAVLARAVAGPVAAYALLMGTLAAMCGAMRSGWARALRVLPLIAALGVIGPLVGYGWGWVVVLAGVGLVSGLGYPSGYLPALMYAGFVPTIVHESAHLADALFAGLFALAGGVVGIELGRRLGAPKRFDRPPRLPGGALLPGIVGCVLMGVGAAIAVATSLPHGYWIPLTLIAVVPVLVTGVAGRGRQRLVGTLAGLLIVIPVSFIAMPPWMFYVLGVLLIIPGLVLMKKNYAYYAFFESAGVVMIVSAGQDVLETGADRALAAVIATMLLVVMVAVVTAILRRLPDAHAMSGARPA